MSTRPFPLHWVAATVALGGTAAVAYHQRELLKHWIIGYTVDISTKATRPAHHDPNGNGFVNPWPSFQRNSLMDTLRMFIEFNWKQAKIPPKEELATLVKLDMDLLNQNSQPPSSQTNGQGTVAGAEGDRRVMATWLGHACFLLQIEGVNVLFDPVFSKSCSPVQWVGPKRYTPPPCKLDELPRVDIVVISHNHYDHLDLATIQALQRDHKPRFFVPLGNKAWFHSIGIKDNVYEYDWWNTHELEFHGGQSHVRVTCTPCQHFTGRSLTDHYKTLWASWVVESVPKLPSEKAIKVFFGGDTGYRTVRRGISEDEVPHCPAFKEIGERIGPFDLSMIPIGAYSPRWFMSSIHCSPEDAVRVHEDIKSKRSVGMHWGTWVLTDEDVREPPRRLEAEMKSRGHDPATFNTIQLGETLVVNL